MTLKLETPTDQMNLRLPEDPKERERLAVMLYDMRTVSQGNAAKIAGLTRAGFIDALGKYGVTPFQYDSLEEMLADAEAARL